MEEEKQSFQLKYLKQTNLFIYNIFCHFTQTVRIIIENPPHRKETQMLYNKIMSNRQNRNLKIKLEARSSKT